MALVATVQNCFTNLQLLVHTAGLREQWWGSWFAHTPHALLFVVMGILIFHDCISDVRWQWVQALAYLLSSVVRLSASSKLQISLDTYPAKAIWPHAHDFRLLQKATFDLIVLYPAQNVSCLRLHVSCMAGLRGVNRWQVNGDVETISGLLNWLDELISFVDMLLASFQIQSAQLCLNLKVLR